MVIKAVGNTASQEAVDSSSRESPAAVVHCRATLFGIPDVDPAPERFPAPSGMSVCVRPPQVLQDVGVGQF